MEEYWSDKQYRKHSFNTYDTVDAAEATLKDIIQEGQTLQIQEIFKQYPK